MNSVLDSTKDGIHEERKIRTVVYPSGKSMIPHLICYQSLAVGYYGFALGRLGSGASLTFATLGLG